MHKIVQGQKLGCGASRLDDHCHRPPITLCCNVQLQRMRLMRSVRTPSGPWKEHGCNAKLGLFAHLPRCRPLIKLRMGRPNPMSRTRYGVTLRQNLPQLCSHAMCSATSVAKSLPWTMGTVSVLSCIRMPKKRQPVVMGQDGMRYNLMNKGAARSYRSCACSFSWTPAGLVFVQYAVQCLHKYSCCPGGGSRC